MGVVINCNDLCLNGGMAVDVIAKIRVFAADRRGGIALVFGFALPVLGIGAAAVMEYSSLSRQRTSLQRAVDGAALGGGSRALACQRG